MGNFLKTLFCCSDSDERPSSTGTRPNTTSNPTEARTNANQASDRPISAESRLNANAPRQGTSAQATTNPSPGPDGTSSGDINRSAPPTPGSAQIPSSNGGPDENLIMGGRAVFNTDSNLQNTQSGNIGPTTSGIQSPLVGSSADAAIDSDSSPDIPPAAVRIVAMEEGAYDAGPDFDLLPPQEPAMVGRKCLVLDLDETLVHSSFKYTVHADFMLPVEIEGMTHDVFVTKRPGVDRFLEVVSQIYEVVVFTASVAKYGDPLLDQLDPRGLVKHRLFRESCIRAGGTYVKNLSMLGRPLESAIIIDNSPAAYALQPENAVPVSSWFCDFHDNELMDMIPILEELATGYVNDVTDVLQSDWSQSL